MDNIIKRLYYLVSIVVCVYVCICFGIIEFIVVLGC